MKDGEHPTGRAWMRSILDRYEQPLTGYAARITGDVESARDVVQEVFLRLCRDQGAQTNGHLPQWLFTVCRNKAVDVQRKNRRLRITHDEATATCDVQAVDPSRVAADREETGRMVAMLSRLPEKQQEVIRLRFQHGLSYKEIAGVTKLSVSNVGYLIHAAIRAIRGKLTISGDEDE